MQDSTLRYRYPYPLAGAFDRVAGALRDSQRFGFAVNLTEGTMRFVGALAVADYLSSGVREPRVEELLRNSPRPTAGKWLEIAREATRPAAEGRAEAFIAELPALLHRRAVLPKQAIDIAEAYRVESGAADPALTESREAGNRLPAKRNEVHNSLVSGTEEGARERYNAIWSDLSSFLAGLEFLTRYRLGAFEDIAPERGVYRVFWREYAGASDNPIALSIVLRHAPPPGIPFLLRPSGDRALRLDPLIALIRRESSDTYLPYVVHELAGSAPRYWEPKSAARPVPRPWPSDHAEDAAVEQPPPARNWSDILDQRTQFFQREALGDVVRSIDQVRAKTSALILGSEVEGWHVREHIRRGGMADVYLVDRTNGGGTTERRALKVLSHDLAADPVLRARMLQEGRRHAALHHESLVRCHAAGALPDGRPYLLLDYHPHGTLADRVLADGPLDATAARAVIDEVLRAIEFLYTRGIVHRDVKPSNILLDAGGHARLGDLGIARSSSETKLTRSGVSPIGTRDYFAPELLRDGVASRASDLYALGLTWAELLGARLPFTAADARRKAVEAGEHAPSWELIASLLSADTEQRRLAFDPPGATGEAPYRGLRAYREEDREIFFGRERNVDEVLERFRQSPVVALDATSGAGKSSLAGAGVIPAIRGGALGEVDKWEVLALSPGRAPLDALMLALPPGTVPGIDATTLRVDPGALFRAFRERALRERVGMLVVVDALEEVTTQCEDATERQAFAAALGAFAGGRTSGVRLLVAYRSDFYDRIAELATLRAMLTGAIIRLGPLGPDEVRAVLRRPAARFGFEFEDEVMLEEAVKATADRVEAIPLCAFALETLWERRDPSRKVLPLAAWREMGGIGGALAKHADQALAGLPPDSREVARKVLTLLVSSDGTRRRWKHLDLLEATGKPASATPVLEHLTKARLIAWAADQEVVLAHEALIRSWGTLRAWLDEGAEDLAFGERLRDAAEAWRKAAETEDLVWRGALLARLAEWALGRALAATEARFLEASRRAARRGRQQRWAIAAGVLAVITAVAGTAFFRVNAARHEAERHQTMAEDLVNYMLFDLRDKLKPIGRLDLLDSVARKVTAYFTARADSEGSDEAAGKQGVAHSNLGDVFLAQGDAAGALREYRAYVEIAGHLAAKDPSNADWQRNLSVSHSKLGNVLLAQGDAPGALHEYRADLEIAERLSAKDPSNTDWQRDLSVSHNKVGNVLLAQGGAAGALREYRAGLEIMERLAAKDPSNTDWQRDLSVSHNKIGGVLLAQGDAAGALREYRADLEIAERLAAKDPSNTGWQRDLSVSHNKIGNVLLAQNDATGAAGEYRAGLEIMERLAPKDPSNTGWQRDLSISHNKIGDVLLAHGDVAGALRESRAGLEIGKRLAEKDPSNTDWQRDLSVSHHKIGGILLAQGDAAGATREYRANLEIAKRLAAKDPSNTGWQRDVSVSHATLGDVLFAQHQREEALGHYRWGLENSERLVALDPTNATWKGDRDFFAERLRTGAPSHRH